MGYPTQAMQAQGVKIQRGDGGGTETFTTIAEIHNFSGPTEKAKAIDVTNLDSQAKEFINGLMDPGEVSFEGNYVAGDAMQQGLRADLVARVRRNFRILLTDDLVTPTTITFTAVITDFSIKGAADDKLSFSCALKISGVPNIAYKA